MPETMEKNVVEEATTEAPVIKEAPVKKQRKPREKVRDVEEIIDLPLTKLSEKEKDKLINYFKDSITAAANKVDAYKNNAETNIMRYQELNDRYDAMETFYRKKLNYVSMQLDAFKSAIDTAIKGGAM